MLLRPWYDIALNILHLLCPAAVIHAECFDAAVAWDFVETRLSEQKQCAALGLLQPEFDERGRLLRIIYFGIERIRVPSEGKEPFGLHFLHDGFPFHVLVARYPACNCKLIATVNPGFIASPQPGRRAPGPGVSGLAFCPPKGARWALVWRVARVRGLRSPGWRFAPGPFARQTHPRKK